MTKITLNATDGVLYTPVGVRYWALNSKTNDWNNGTMNFYDGKPVNFAGFDSDGRLNTKEIIVEPNLQVSNNTIQVRIQTNLLSKFDTAIEYDEDGKITHHAGVLAQDGTVVGEYTYFTFADETNTVNGKLYAITATPLTDDYVAEWYDATTMRTYVGNTLYFTAMDTPERNIITLSIAPVYETVTLEGTLLYQNYNLRTGYSGNASNVPAVGAALSAGSAGGMANQNGYVTAGPIPVSGGEDRYLRYMVSINGTDMVKELLLPSETSPILFWDFGSDKALSKSMGAHRKGSVEYSGQADSDGNEFYTFTATGSDPRISMDTPVDSAESLSWVKIRAKNLSGADVIELFACLGDNTNVTGNSCVHIPLAKDQNWHEYIVCIPDANVATANTYKGANLTSTVWKGKVNWLRLDPMEMEDGSAIQSGSQIQIDYVAFFSDEDSANAFLDGAVADTNPTIDISSKFPSGVSLVNSAIFNDVQITGKMSDSAYQVQDNTYIPVVLGKSADMTIKIKPAEYSYTMTGEKGAVIQGSKTESPVSVQLVVYDSNDVFKDVYDAVDSFSMKSGYMTATSRLDFVEPSEGVVRMLKDIVEYVVRGFLSGGKVVERDLIRGACELFKGDIERDSGLTLWNH